MKTATGLTGRVDTTALEQKVKAMYRDVALAPQGEFHFEMGRALAERLGYAPADLDTIPSEAIDSFAGVGYYFDLARLRPGEPGCCTTSPPYVRAATITPTGRSAVETVPRSPGGGQTARTPQHRIRQR